MPFPFVPPVVLLIFIASQVYWLRQGLRLARRCIADRRARRAVRIAGLAAYFLTFAYNFFGRFHAPTSLTVSAALLVAPFSWWVFSSMVAFVVVMVLRPVLALRRLVNRAPRAENALASPQRRDFLLYTARAATAAPFFAGGYALFYGRLNLETTHRRIRLARLPGAFKGFRIAQLSDIHIGPFMSQAQIRRYAAIANGLKPDLIVLTGDFVTWDPGTQSAVVEALATLRAPLGVYGCLGNHERMTGTEDSITRLFTAAGIRMLRGERVPIATGGESLNLAGVDYVSSRHSPRGYIAPLRNGVAALLTPGAVNILMSHNPHTFDDAAALGVDLTLAGHTHGGQVALEFISPKIAPSRLVTPYVSGWFEKPGGQLYVNRGIGTVGAPMRVGASPEITVFELTRRA